MNRIINLLLVYMIISVLIGVPFIFSDYVTGDGLADTPWPTFRGNERNTGLSPYNTSHIDETKSWKYLLFGKPGIYSATIGNNGTIYGVTYDTQHYDPGRIDAINPEESNFYWMFGSEERLTTTSVARDGTLYVGSWDNNLYALNNKNGKEKWRFTANDSILSSPNIGNDGIIYVGSADYNLYAINPDSTEKWHFNTNGAVSSSPAISNQGTIYVGSDDNNLYAINPDGTQNWNFTTDGAIGSSPALNDDGTIYVGSEDNKVYAIYPNGTQKWNFTTGGKVYSSPAIGPDGTIYIGSLDNNLYAINPDGTEKWRFATGGSIFSSPSAAAEGTIYVGSMDNNLYAIYPNGTLKWTFSTHGQIYSSPVISEKGIIYIISNDDYLYAIGEEEESESYFLFPLFCWRDLLIVTLIIIGVIYLLIRWKRMKDNEHPMNCYGNFEPETHSCIICDYKEECEKDS